MKFDDDGNKNTENFHHSCRTDSQSERMSILSILQRDNRVGINETNVEWLRVRYVVN